MTLQDFSTYAASRGMLVSDGMAFGEINGYPFTIHAKGSQVRSMTVSFKLAQRLPRKGFKSVKQALSAQGISGCKVFYFNNDYQMLGLTCAGRDQDLWNKVFMAMEVTTRSLLESGMTPPQTCPICKQDMCDSLAYVGGGYVPVHKACCENLSYNALSSAEANQNSGNMGLGILGAVLGGTIATIPTILTIFFLELISAWLYALIPLGAYFGYRLFKGKMNKAVLPIVIIIAILELFFVQQVTWYLYGLEEGVWTSIADSISAFGYLVDTQTMIQDLIQPAIFTALGIFISYGQIRQNNQTQVQDANLVLRSLFVKAGAPGTYAQGQPAAQPQTADIPAPGENPDKQA